MFVRQVIGAVATVIAFGPIIFASGVLRKRLLPGWFGPPAFLARFIFVLAVSLLTVEALGIVGWFRVAPTVGLLALVGVGAWFGGRRVRQRARVPLPDVPQRLGMPATVIAAGVVSIVAAVWGARTFVALNHGMVSIDSLWYHLPAAARFADTGSILGITHDAAGLSGFYPNASELLNGLGMVLLGNDTFSMIMGFGWGAIALTAAWCIGRPHGVSAVTVSGAAVLLCAPGFVASQPGAAHNDVIGLALILSAAALLVTADPRRVTTDPVVLATAGLAIGAAVATKWTFLPASGLLTLGVVLYLLRNRRFSLAAVWIAPVTLVGCFTYVQNLVLEQNPLPPANLKVAGIGFDAAIPPPTGYESVAAFLLDRSAWNDYLLPGLDLWFGVAWWGVVAAAGLGLLLAVVAGSGYMTRMLGVVGALAGVSYLVSPQYLTLFGRPEYFVSNLRYGVSALMLGLVLLPVARPLNGARRPWIPMGLFVAMVVAMQLDPTIWPTELRDTRVENAVGGADAVAGVVIGVVAFAAALGFLWLRRRDTGPERNASNERAPRSRRRTFDFVAVGVAIALSLVFVQDFYMARRYNRPDAAVPFQALHWKSWQYFRDKQDARIGMRNSNLAYPLLGNDFSNHVEHVGGREKLGFGLAEGSPDVPDCEAWRRELNAADLDHVVLYGLLARPTVDLEPIRRLPEVRWLVNDPAVTVPLEGNQEIVFQIDGQLDPSTCPADG